MASVEQLQHWLKAAGEKALAGDQQAQQQVEELLNRLRVARETEADAPPKLDMDEIRRQQYAAQLKMADEMPWHEQMLVGTGKAFTDIGRGGQALWEKTKGRFGELDEERMAELRADEEEAARLYAPLQEAAPVATFAGEMLPYLATAPIGGGGLTAAALRGGQGAMKKLAAGAGIEGLIGGTQAALGSPIDDQGEAFGWGATISAGIPILGNALRHMGNRAVDAYQLAKQADVDRIPLSPGQRLGSEGLTKLEENVAKIPGMGSAFRGIDDAQQKGINRLALESIGETGEELSGGVLREARENIGKRFEDAIGRNEAFNYDTKFKKLLRDVKTEWKGSVGKGAGTDVPLKAADDILQKIKDSRGMLSARRYQEISSDLSDLLDSGIRGKEKRMVRKIKTGLDDMMERNLGGEKLTKFREARKQWRNLNDIKNSLDEVDLESGNISPLKLYNRLRRKDPERLGTAMDPLTRAARFGKRLKPLVPNPGSAAALMVPASIGGAYTLGGGDPVQALQAAGLGMAAPWLYRGGMRGMAPAMQRGMQSAPVRQMAPQALTGTPGQLLRSGMMQGVVPGLLDDQ